MLKPTLCEPTLFKYVYMSNNFFTLIWAPFLVKLFHKAENLVLCDKIKSKWQSKLWVLLNTYIVSHYKPSVRVIELVSHTTYVVFFLILYVKWRDLQFKVDSERQIFWETFHCNFYLLSEFLPVICWEEIVAEIFFVFCFDVWGSNPGFSSNKPTHYPLDHGD